MGSAHHRTRRWLALVPVTLLLSSTHAAATAETVQPDDSRPCVLSVTDDRSVGALRDQRLSLVEAVSLVQGDLSRDELDRSENSRVRCGADYTRPRIGLDLSQTDMISFEAPFPVLDALPPGTVLDGNGGTIEATAAEAGTALSLASSGIVVRDWTIHGFATGVGVVPGGRTGAVRDVILRRLRIASTTYGINVLGADSSGTLDISGVDVRGGHIEGLPSSSGEALVGVNVTGTTVSAPARVRDLSITGVSFGKHMLERIQIVGAQGLAGQVTLSGGPQLADITVARNAFTECLDPCVLAYAALALAGDVSGATIEGLRVVDNVIPASGYGIDLIGGYTLGPGTTSRARISDVHIARNRITPGAGASGSCTGIAVVGDWTDFHAGVAQEGSISDVHIRRNHVSGCRVGVMAVGTFAVEEVGGVVSGSSVEDIEVVGNTVERGSIGLLVGGAVLRFTRFWGNLPSEEGAATAVLRENSADRVQSRANTFRDLGLGSLFVGASILSTNGHVVVDNAVTGSRAVGDRHERVDLPCSSVDVERSAAVVAVGNRVDGSPCPS